MSDSVLIIAIVAIVAIVGIVALISFHKDISINFRNKKLNVTVKDKYLDKNSKN